MNTFRTLIISEVAKPTVQQLTWLIVSEEQASNMWNTPLSQTWELPATHYISSWMINDEFASLLPCYAYTSVVSWEWEDAIINNEWTKIYDWQAEYIATATWTEKETIENLFTQIDVSEQDSFQAMERLGLKLITE